MKIPFIRVFAAAAVALFAVNAFGQTKPFDTVRMDKSVAPCNDFFEYVNGAWLKNTQIPATETRWGTFTDPWVIQPQPKCGFIIAGTEGTLSSYGHEKFVTLQTRKKPKPHSVAAPNLKSPMQNPVEYLLHSLETGQPLEGPVSLAISRIGQEIVDAAVRSAKLKRAVKLK